MVQLPSLNGLKAFEAVARHLSFTKAASELGVTQAAVSHQIKALEAQLGTRLLTRSNRTTALTPAGASFAVEVRDAFERLARASQRFMGHGEANTLTVSVGAALASHWLIARLNRFRARHPDISVRLNVTSRLVDLRHEDVDVAIRQAHEVSEGLHATRVAQQRLVLVASPALLAEGQPLASPADLRHHLLLRETNFDWAAWLRANGVKDPEDTHCLEIDSHGAVIDAAIAGQGVALARSFVVAEKLASGVLVNPLPMRPPPDFPNIDMCFVCLPAAADLPKVRAFRDWILGETAAMAPAHLKVGGKAPTTVRIRKGPRLRPA